MEIPASPVFQGITKEEWREVQASLPMKQESVRKGDVIFHQGEIAREMGLVLMGGVHIESVDLWGNRSILSHIGQGQVFAETYALTGGPLLVDAVAAVDSQILRIDLSELLHEREESTLWNQKILKNLVTIFAQKNRALSGRIFCTSSKSIRGRVVTYLSAQALEQGSHSFFIPFDRQQLADYLSVDRSALSKELGRMRDEGLLEFRKNHFTLLHLPEKEEG